MKAWEAYLNYPSSENANKVSALLPDSSDVEYTGSEQEEVAFDSIWKNLGTLEYQMYAGDRSAVGLAFRLFSIADGGFAEDSDMIIGSLIRINRRLFLEELKSHRPLVVRLDALVGNFGSVTGASDEADKLETDLRVKSLKAVNDPNLKDIRDECIRELKK